MSYTANVVKTIIFNKETNKLLILKRSDYKPRYKDLWDFPGGNTDEDEILQKAAIRECHEETQIIIKENSIKDILSYSMPHKDNTFNCHIYISEEFELTNKQVKISHEHTKYKWIEIEELDSLNMLNCLQRVKSIIIEELKNKYYIKSQNQ